MPANYDKLWQQESLARIASGQAQSQIRQTGRALPCHVTAVSGAIVTVAFDVATADPLPSVTIPKAESNWIRMPTQVGDFGVVIAADTYLEFVAGMASGTAALSQPANLSGLLFVPVSNATQPPPVANAAIVQGPAGAVIQTTAGTASSIVTNTDGTKVTFGSTTVTLSSGEIKLTAGGKTLTIDSAGITLDGTLWETHVHTGVTTGSGDTGPIP